MVSSLLMLIQILANRLPFRLSLVNVSYLKFAHGKKELVRPSYDEGRITDTMWEVMQECWVKECTKRPPANILADRILKP